MRYIKQKAAISLAQQIRRHESDLSWSDALRFAWDYVKHNFGKFNVVSFTKTDGTATTRVVTKWSDHNTVKGTGKAKPAGLRLFADVARILTGKSYNTVSCYDHAITFFA